MGLPDFDRPPVVEVALSVQFAPLQAVTNAHFGRLWAEVFCEEFPDTEERPCLDHVIERLGAPAPGEMKLQIGPALLRYWFKNADGTELIQVQHDRFVRNWRQLRTGRPYPRFEPLCDKLMKDFRSFVEFVEKRGLGEVVPDQCEITYVNELDGGEGWDSFGDVAAVVTVWQSRFSDDFLPSPEEIRFNTSFVIPGEGGRPAGRLHVAVEPRYRLPKLDRLLRLSLTARGAPIGAGLDGVRGFMDLGRKWVVKGFASITTRHMHQIWERTGDR